METLSPLGKVFHAGTLAGNPLATAAGRAALGELTGDVYMELLARARQLSANLRDACAAAGLPAQLPPSTSRRADARWWCSNSSACPAANPVVAAWPHRCSGSFPSI
jgi:hypothetical protein